MKCNCKDVDVDHVGLRSVAVGWHAITERKETGRSVLGDLGVDSAATNSLLQCLNSVECVYILLDDYMNDLDNDLAVAVFCRRGLCR